MSLDLIAELNAIRERAKRTRESIESGRAKNGMSGLMQIEKQAEDVIRHVTAAPNAQPDNGRT